MYYTTVFYSICISRSIFEPSDTLFLDFPIFDTLFIVQIHQDSKTIQ